MVIVTMMEGSARHRCHAGHATSRSCATAVHHFAPLDVVRAVVREVRDEACATDNDAHDCAIADRTGAERTMNERAALPTPNWQGCDSG
jgi:hypothetical protein